MTIFRFTSRADLVWPSINGPEILTDLGDVDGAHYMHCPASVTMPEQPDEAGYATVSDAEELAALRRTSGVFTQNRIRVRELLSESDWTQLSDTGLTSSQGQSWADYRGALRAIMEANDPAPAWPDKPEMDVSAYDAAVLKIDRVHAGFLRRATGNASMEERDTWQAKALAAEAFLGNTASKAQKAGLKAEADMTGVTSRQLATAIRARANAYIVLLGKAAGWRRAAMADIKTAKTDEEILASLAEWSEKASAAMDAPGS